MNMKTIDFIKTKGVEFFYYGCTEKYKQNEAENIPVGKIPQTKGTNSSKNV